MAEFSLLGESYSGFVSVIEHTGRSYEISFFSHASALDEG